MGTKWFVKNRITDEDFISICNSAQTMADAASQMKLHFNSFKKRAEELGCYKPNQAGKGLNKIMPKIPIEEIIYQGKHPNFQSYKLKKRLLEDGIKSNVCESCQISEWNGRPIQMELHHIDGDRTNHKIDNIVLLCPNCHSQTETFRAKNKKG
jgi:hypothetical protein